MSYSRFMSDYDAAYANQPHYFGAFSPLLTRFADRIPPGSKVLDIGVGQGRNAMPLAARGLHVVGVDEVPAAIEAARAAALASSLELELHCLDVEKLGAEDGEFTGILLFGVIQETPRAKVDRLLTLVRRWLAPGGLFFVRAWHTLDPSYGRLKSSGEAVGRNSFRSAEGLVRTYLEPGEAPLLVPGWEILLHTVELGLQHRHGDGQLHQHGDVEMVARKPLS